MGVQRARWVASGSAVGAILGIVASKGGGVDWGATFALGLIGACLGAIGAWIIRLARPRTRSTANLPALAGAVVCALGGIPIGVISGLGRPMLAVFNPDLPRQDFEGVFGGLGGVFVGAVFGTLAGSLVARLRGGPTEVPDTSEDA